MTTRRPQPLLAALCAVAVLSLASAAAVAAPHASVAPPKYEDVIKGGPQAVLEASDEIHFYETMDVTGTLVVRSGDGKVEQTIRLRMIQDGPKRLIRMLDPPEVRGMGILIRSRTTMYVYLPEFDKERPAASHARKQTFLGSDFNYDDMAMSKLSPDYVATLDTETDTEIVLLLTVRPERKDVVIYPKLRVTIDKKTLQMVRQEYFEADGRHVRTQIRGNMRTWKSPDYAVQSEVKMIDHENRDHSTTLTFTEFEAMMEVPGRFFTKRTLVRGE